MARAGLCSGKFMRGQEPDPSDWYYTTQGGGKAVYDELGQLYFREAHDWAPEMEGTIVPEEWGICGPFQSQEKAGGGER